MSPFDLDATGETPKAWVARHDESTIVEKSFIVDKTWCLDSPCALGCVQDKIEYPKRSKCKVCLALPIREPGVSTRS